MSSTAPDQAGPRRRSTMTVPHRSRRARRAWAIGLTGALAAGVTAAVAQTPAEAAACSSPVKYAPTSNTIYLLTAQVWTPSAIKLACPGPAGAGRRRAAHLGAERGPRAQQRRDPAAARLVGRWGCRHTAAAQPRERRRHRGPGDHRALGDDRRRRRP